MTERADAGGQESGIRLTREVLEALPPLSREDEAVAAIVEGMIVAAELLKENDTSTTEP